MPRRKHRAVTLSRRAIAIFRRASVRSRSLFVFFSSWSSSSTSSSSSFVVIFYEGSGRIFLKRVKRVCVSYVAQKIRDTSSLKTMLQREESKTSAIEMSIESSRERRRRRRRQRGRIERKQSSSSSLIFFFFFIFSASSSFVCLFSLFASAETKVGPRSTTTTTTTATTPFATTATLSHTGGRSFTNSSGAPNVVKPRETRIINGVPSLVSSPRNRIINGGTGV